MVLMVPQPRSSAPVGLSQGWGGQSYPVPGSGLTQPGPWLWLRVCLLHLEQPVSAKAWCWMQVVLTSSLAPGLLYTKPWATGEVAHMAE